MSFFRTFTLLYIQQTKKKNPVTILNKTDVHDDIFFTQAPTKDSWWENCVQFCLD